ncbi:hypothetical protein [Methanimicrococcus hongohii]|uniref:hypothetical protein n=1 Tax=Methanimicrococcus hongohii TaxID=3028295 RepID=UPI00292EEDF4|nr:hypothetical protein [Methanimicrococcus sp. Hf6]
MALNFVRFAHKISGCSGREVFVCSGSQVSVSACRPGLRCRSAAASGSRSSCPPPRASRTNF